MGGTWKYEQPSIRKPLKDFLCGALLDGFLVVTFDQQYLGTVDVLEVVRSPLRIGWSARLTSSNPGAAVTCSLTTPHSFELLNELSKRFRSRGQPRSFSQTATDVGHEDLVVRNVSNAPASGVVNQRSCWTA